MISSEMPELLGLADRILVMAGGRVVAEMPREQASEERILSLAMADNLTKRRRRNDGPRRWRAWRTPRIVPSAAQVLAA